MKVRLSIAAALALAACTPRSDTRPIPELFVSPTAFVVNGTSFNNAPEAVARVTAANPAQISIVSCSAVPTQRVQDVMQGVQLRFKGSIVMSVVGPGERGCPSTP